MKKQTKAQRLKWAEVYINYCNRNGMDIDITGWKPNEIISYANDLQGKADLAYDDWKERNL